MWQGPGLSWKRSHLKEEQFCTENGMLLNWGQREVMEGTMGPEI